MEYCRELGKDFFPLVTTPLLRVNVVYDIDQTAFTVIYIPHIIMDAYSNSMVLCSELVYLYRSFVDSPSSSKTFENFRAELKDPKPFADFVEEEKLILRNKLEFAKRYYKEKYKPST